MEHSLTITQVLVAIPVLNEAMTLGPLLESISSIKLDSLSLRVMVIDDGSSDETVQVARQHGARVISHSRNLGLGVAFQTAVKEAIISKADILVTIDGDGQFDGRNIENLLGPIVNGEANMVTASRFQPGAKVEMPWIKRWGNRKVAGLVSWLTGSRIHDASCGFRAYSRQVFLQLSLIGSFTYTHEAILAAAFRGFTIQEVTVPVRGSREYGHSRMASNLYRYGANSLLIILRSYRDFRPMLLFGMPSLFLCALGILLLLLFIVASLIKGEFFPKSAAFTGAFCLGVGLVLFLVAMIADMFTRLRLYLENLTRLVDKNRDPGPHS